jgi:hypothetical protein
VEQDEEAVPSASAMEIPRAQMASRAITSASSDASRSAREKSQPRNGAGEIFMTATAEIARETVSAANRFERKTGNPRKLVRKIEKDNNICAVALAAKSGSLLSHQDLRAERMIL